MLTSIDPKETTETFFQEFQLLVFAYPEKVQEAVDLRVAIARKCRWLETCLRGLAEQKS